jgi:hypothetical protein
VICGIINLKSPKAVQTRMCLHCIKWVAIDSYFCGRGIMSHPTSGVVLSIRFLIFSDMSEGSFFEAEVFPEISLL